QIYVPADQVAKLRLSLASEGIPAGGSIGYELFDRADALGTTNFVQQINQIRALEGELARTIRSIRQVRAARVHLVMPKRELFSNDRAEPTASVVLTIGGGLDKGQVSAIQHLIASAVPGMKARSEERRVGKECRCGWFAVRASIQRRVDTELQYRVI